MARPSDEELIARWYRATAELHRRNIKLWHAGDFAELLVARAIGGSRVPSNVHPGYDLLGPDERRWQVNAMVNRPGNIRTSVGWLRPETFDVLAIVAFAEDMRSVQAWTVPPDLVVEYAQARHRRSAWKLGPHRRRSRRDLPHRLEEPV
jgi:hypothetical protein